MPSSLLNSIYFRAKIFETLRFNSNPSQKLNRFTKNVSFFAYESIENGRHANNRRLLLKVILNLENQIAFVKTAFV